MPPSSCLWFMFSPVIKVHGPDEYTKECDNGK
jgi:hypothetical protein